jgi:hypothetical protein
MSVEPIGSSLSQLTSPRLAHFGELRRRTRDSRIFSYSSDAGNDDGTVSLPHNGDSTDPPAPYF